MSFNVAVKFYWQFPLSKETLTGIPTDWTALVHELKDGVVLESIPDYQNFTIMSKEDLDAYQAERQDSVDAWRRLTNQ